MKTLTTILISIIALVATANANENIEITTVATSLNGTTNNNTVVLNWSAKNITANSRFEIERSFYSNNFTTISTMTVAFANNSNFRINDNAAELAGRKIAYYRVKLVNANGTTTYSNTMVVNLEANQSNIVKTNTSINFTAAQNGNAVITVKNLAGKTVATQNAISSKGNNTVVVNMDGLAKGIYVSEVSVNGVVVNNQKVIAE